MIAPGVTVGHRAAYHCQSPSVEETATICWRPLTTVWALESSKSPRQGDADHRDVGTVRDVEHCHFALPIEHRARRRIPHENHTAIENQCGAQRVSGSREIHAADRAVCCERVYTRRRSSVLTLHRHGVGACSVSQVALPCVSPKLALSIREE
eukprot:2547909-Prymnesium_polylepis.1